MTSKELTNMPVVAIVTFPATRPLNNAALRDLLEEAGPRYTHVDGLHRKYFISSETSGGGVYEWASREQAQAFYTDDWYAQMRSQVGAQPQVTLFDAPAIANGVDHTLEIYVSES